MPLNVGLTLDSIPAKTRELMQSGIRNPRVRTLAPGERIFRMSSSLLPRDRWPGGPWWFGEQAYRRIVAEFLKSPTGSVGFAARRALAILQCWSKVDVLIEAITNDQITCFCGRGEKQYREIAPNGMYVTWEGWADIEQLFIPSISDRTGLTPDGRRAINIVKMDQVDSYQMF